MWKTGAYQSTLLASALTCLDEFDVVERLHDEAFGGVVVGHDPIHLELIQMSKTARANTLCSVGRARRALDILRRSGPRLELCEAAARVQYAIQQGDDRDTL